MFPNNMNDAAISGSMVEPARPVAPPPAPAEQKKFPWKIVLPIGGAVLVIAVIIIVVVMVTSNRRTVSNYEIPEAAQVEYSTTTTAWLGNYFFTIPDAYNFELGMDDPYEALYLTRSGETSASTEIAYLDDIDYSTITASGVINNYLETLRDNLGATNAKASATRVNNVEFYYMDFDTADGKILFAFTEADLSSFLVVVTGGTNTVEERLVDGVTVLRTAKEMAAADKGVPDDAGDIVNAGALLEDLRLLDL